MAIFVSPSSGGSTSPGGSTTQLQFNDGGVFGGDVDLTWNKTTNLLTVAGDVNLSDGGAYTTTLQTITPTANRTVSIPDATGTLALVAGSSGQLLWNNAGANAGASTLTYDGSILTTSGRFINSYNAAASSPAKTFTGTWFTGGTSTTTKPHVLIEPTGTTSTAWSTSGTGLGVNAASAFFAGNFIDCQLNGTSVIRVKSQGIAIATPGVEYTIERSASDGILRFYGTQSAVYSFVFTGSRGEALRINTSDNLQFAEGKNIETGTTTGTKIGTATTQKLGFYNKTPVVQPAAVADATDAATAITQLNALLARMRDLGLIAT